MRPQPEPIEIVYPTVAPTPSPGPLVVHVVGAVRHPGVYALPQQSRLADAVAAAGGLTEEADVATVNLADWARDGQQIRIPEAGAQPSAGPTLAEGVVSRLSEPVDVVTDKVNLNTATLDELDALPGIGPVYAQRIIDYRETQGPFEDPAEIMEIKGIGPACYEGLKDCVTVR
jgi:competence protein ComEA